MVECSFFPEYPKVVVEGTAVVIHYENGEKEIWGYEPNEKIAEEISKEIQLGLQAINYVSLEVWKTLGDISEQMELLGIPADFARDYLFEGYIKVSKWFNALNAEKVT